MESDYSLLCDLFKDSHVMRFLDVRDEVKSRESLNRYLDQWEKHGFGFWRLNEKKSGSFVGVCGLRYLEKELEVELGYVIHRAFWNMGLATEASRASLQYGFEELKAKKIVAVVHPHNENSKHVLQKLGMVFEKKGFFYEKSLDYFAIHRADFSLR